ncbi:MAG: S-layer homology domain-containing protein [Evtepia sp.]
MMLSVMVVGAGAAFSDQSKIKNTEAVDACTALNIIGGYPDGSFKPEGNITRAEVTKMICVALNGGKNPAVSTNTTPTFSDVRNNANAAWAEELHRVLLCTGHRLRRRRRQVRPQLAT